LVHRHPLITPAWKVDLWWRFVKRLPASVVYWVSMRAFSEVWVARGNAEPTSIDFADVTGYWGLKARYEGENEPEV
jgi:hypothetical protein